MTHIADPIDQVPKALGRTITPYVGQTLIYIGVSVFLVYVAIKTSKFNTLWALGVMWPLYAFSTLYFGLKYRVLWDDAGVIMRASGGPERRIQYAEITRIELETGVSQSRPLRRIVVYGPKHHSNGFIDISLRHFRLEDIRQLFQMIQARRHDLTLPKVQFERGFW